MSFELPNPKDLRLKRIQEDNASDERSVSNFSLIYRVGSKNPISDDEDDSPSNVKKSDCFSVNFEDDQGKSRHSKFAPSNESLHKTSYENLTERSKKNLDAFEDTVQAYRAGEVTLDELKKELEKIRIVLQSPVLEFDDFTSLKNFNLPLSRDLPGMGPVALADGRVCFNNLVNVALLSLDLDASTYVLKNIRKLKDDDIVSFVASGHGSFNKFIITSSAVDTSIHFIDCTTEEVLFRIHPHKEIDFATVLLSTVNEQYAFLVYDNWSIQVLDVSS